MVEETELKEELELSVVDEGKREDKADKNAECRVEDPNAAFAQRNSYELVFARDKAALPRALTFYANNGRAALREFVSDSQITYFLEHSGEIDILHPMLRACKEVIYTTNYLEKIIAALQRIIAADPIDLPAPVVLYYNKDKHYDMPLVEIKEGEAELRAWQYVGVENIPCRVLVPANSVKFRNF